MENSLFSDQDLLDIRNAFGSYVADKIIPFITNENDAEDLLNSLALAKKHTNIASGIMSKYNPESRFVHYVTGPGGGRRRKEVSLDKFIKNE